MPDNRWNVAVVAGSVVVASGARQAVVSAGGSMVPLPPVPEFFMMHWLLEPALLPA